MSSKVLAKIAFIKPAKEKTIEVSKTTETVRNGCWTSTLITVSYTHLTLPTNREV